jgi:O-antigen ligase
MSPARRSLFLTLLGVLIVIGAAAAITIDHDRQLRGVSIGFPDPIAPPVRGLGVNVALEQYDATSLKDNLAQIDAAGFTWLRQVFPWAQIEPEQGRFEWTVWDQIVTQSKDFHLIAVLDTAPVWAAASNPSASLRTGLQPPTSALPFANFARSFAQRYGDRIDYYQIWDEPNLGDRWGGEANPVAYAELLRQARDTIKQADPTATIILAGLAPTVERGPRDLADWLFLRRLYEAGAHDLFDVVAGKPYGFDTPPDDARIDPGILNFQHVVLLREEMVQHGDAGKALWASHFGWNTAVNSIWGRVTPAQQINFAQRALQYAAAAWPWSGVLIVENWEPDAPPADPRWGFSIKHNPNLGQNLIVSAGVGFYPAALQTRPGSLVYQPHPAATFTGEWRFSELGADWSATGDRVSFTFKGTALALRVRRAADRANLYITIDGQPANALPRDERGAYLQLIPPEINQPEVRTLPVATGLNDGEHRVEIVTERGWQQWSLIGWSVGREDDRGALDGMIGVLSVLGLAVAYSAWRNARRMRWREVGGRVSAVYARLSNGRQIVLTVSTALIVYGSAWLTWGVDSVSAYRRAGDTANLLATLAAATVFYISPWLILTLISGLVLLVLVCLRLDLGLALVALFAPFFMLPRPLFESAFSMSELVLVMCVVGYVLRTAYSVRQAGSLRILHPISRFSPLDWSVLAFLLVSIASTLFADYKMFALRELRVIIFEPVIYYALIRAAKLDDKARWRLVDALLAAGVVVAVIGLAQYTFNLNLITAEEGTLRLRSVYGSPNNVGLFLGRVLPIGLAVAVLGRGRRRTAYALALLPIAVAIGLSQSRGAILLGVPAAILAIGVLAGGRRLWASIGTLLVAGAAALPLLNSPRLQALVSGAGGTSFFRVAVWQSALELIGDQPWLGVGPDNFLYAYRGRYLRPAAWQEPSLSHPHNVVLDFAARLGLIGLAAFVAMQVAFWRVAWRVARETKSSLRIEQWSLTIGLMASMIDFLAHGLVDAAYFVVDLSFVFMLTLALMQEFERRSASES